MARRRVLPDLVARLRLDADGFDNRLKKVERNVGSLGKQATRTGDIFKGVFSAQVAGAALAGIAGFVGEGVKALANLDRLSKQTDQVIKSTGGVAGVSAKQVADLAESIEKLTGIEQEGVREAQNLLLTFTSISAKGGVFERATRAAIDLSVAFGQDAKSSAIQLGKALNDPIRGITALSRVGVSFTEQQKEQIRTMQEAGDIAGAQGVILAELEKQVGGSAAAFGDSLAGKVEKAKNRIGDFQEELAGRLIPFIADTAIPKLEEFGAVLFGTKAQGPSDFELGLQRLKQTYEDIEPVLTRVVGLLNATARFVTTADERGIATAVDQATEGGQGVSRQQAIDIYSGGGGRGRQPSPVDLYTNRGTNQTNNFYGVYDPKQIASELNRELDWAQRGPSRAGRM